MEGLAVTARGQQGQAAASGPLRDLGLVALLLAVAVGVHVWLLRHTEVAARDSIGFIRYALQFEQNSWGQVLRGNHQHPGYPLSVLAVSVPVRAFVHAPLADLMRLSAQLASAMAAILLVVPMYFLGKLLYDRATGFWAALVFQCLPITGHILSDGLSEALFLLLTATTLLLASRGVRDRSPLCFALCGVFSGLAYMTRPEGVLLPAAALLVLLGLQCTRAWRRPWKNTLACAASLTLAAVAAGSPYFLATGQFTTKPSGHQILGYPKEPPPAPHAEAAAPVLLAAVPAVVLSNDGPLLWRLLRGLWGLGTELANGFHYVFWAPVLLGLWWYCRRAWTVPGLIVLLALCLFHALVLWRLAVVVGYLSDRHIQVLVLCGMYPAVTAIRELPLRVGGWLQARGRLPASPSLRWLLSDGAPLLSAGVLLTFTAAGMPKTLQTLHGNRAGYHAAGLWLADHVKPFDFVLDRHCWAGYYAGCIFREGHEDRAAPAAVRTEYHVVGRGKGGTEPVPDNPIFLTERRVRELGGVPVYHWPARAPLARAAVVVYALPHLRPARAAAVPAGRDLAAAEEEAGLDPFP
jgi:4-amino-4-deoxy-L-arabinose transferase-like glycosyltransferase